MTNRLRLGLPLAGLGAGVVLLAALAGCAVQGSFPHPNIRGSATVQLQPGVVMSEDYDYYPGYEVYYSRNRQEYLYHDGNAWVRRPAPRGVTLDVLRTAPSVRMDFHDAPEQHHAAVVRSYPKNWTPPGQKHADQNDRNGERKNDRKSEDRKE